MGEVSNPLHDNKNALTIKEGDNFLALGEKDFYFHIDGVATFSIENAKNVKIELADSSTLDNALPYFYGTVLTVMMHMKYLFPIHASAVVTPNGLNLFCAASGTGKSTLAMNLFQRGYPLFSDDKCIVKWDQYLKCYTSTPAIRAVRLWQDAIDNIDNNSVLRNGKTIIEKEEKYQFNLNEKMYNRVHKIKNIFLIRKVEGLKEIEFQPLVREEKLLAFKSQIHRPKLIVGEEMLRRFEKFSLNVARIVPIFIVRKPANIPIKDFVDFMEMQIKG